MYSTDAILRQRQHYQLIWSWQVVFWGVKKCAEPAPVVSIVRFFWLFPSYTLSIESIFFGCPRPALVWTTNILSLCFHWMRLQEKVNILWYCSLILIFVVLHAQSFLNIVKEAINLNFIFAWKAVTRIEPSVRRKAAYSPCYMPLQSLGEVTIGNKMNTYFSMYILRRNALRQFFYSPAFFSFETFSILLPPYSCF